MLTVMLQYQCYLQFMGPWLDVSIMWHEGMQQARRPSVCLKHVMCGMC